MHLRTLDAVLLLLHDDATGRPLVSDRVWERFVMGVALVEMLVDGTARLERVPSAAPPVVRGTRVRPRDPLLAELLDTVEGRDFATATRGHDGLLPGMRGLVDALLDARLRGLAAAGMLSRSERTLLGVPVETVWLPGPRHDLEQRLRDRLAAAVLGTGPVDQEVVLLLAILHPTGSLPAVLPDLGRDLVIDRGSALVSGTWLAQALFELTYIRTGSGGGDWLYR